MVLDADADVVLRAIESQAGSALQV